MENGFPILINWMSPLSFCGVSGFFFFHLSMKFMSANRIAIDEMLRFGTSHVGYTNCLCPVNRTPGLNELRLFHTHCYYRDLETAIWQSQTSCL